MATKTMITVRRPDGLEETLDVTERFPLGISPTVFAAIVKSTRDAGRGEVLRTWQVEPARSAAEVAQLAVYKLQAAAEALEDDPGRYIPARMAWEKALREWRLNYPTEAAAEDAAAAARHEERMAPHKDAIARALRLED